MALRNILTQGDEQLLKHSRKVEKFDARLHTLIDDMRETLENSGGVGLAAPQVGVLRRVVVLLDINKDPEEVVELVNPEVIEQSGEQRIIEGCLSVPGVYGYVTRPTWAKIRAQDRDGNWFEREGEGDGKQFLHGFFLLGCTNETRAPRRAHTQSPETGNSERPLCLARVPGTSSPLNFPYRITGRAARQWRFC